MTAATSSMFGVLQVIKSQSDDSCSLAPPACQRAGQEPANLIIALFMVVQCRVLQCSAM